jgi:hypothetical protein
MVSPSFICEHLHAVVPSATIWQTRIPVFIVQGRPITPFPSALYTIVHHKYTAEFKHGKLLHIKRLLFREKRRGGYDRVILRAKVWRRLRVQGIIQYKLQ